MSLDTNLVTLASARNIGALATLKRDGRPQISSVSFTLDPDLALARVCVIDESTTVHNMRRDPRASIYVASPDGWTYAVLEGAVELSPVAVDPEDDTVDELVDIFRAIYGHDHPDWEGYRVAMVAERHVVARLRIEDAYGIAGRSHTLSA